MYVEKKCRLFGLHFEPICYESQEIGIHVRKKHAPHVHAHHTPHTHASHIHSHNTMYGHVYTCTHYGRKGHIAKFCYDRINDSNFANKFIWVRKGANPYGTQ